MHNTFLFVSYKIEYFLFLLGEEISHRFRPQEILDFIREPINKIIRKVIEIIIHALILKDNIIFVIGNINTISIVYGTAECSTFQDT